jgi:hypothetical protein
LLEEVGLIVSAGAAVSTAHALLSEIALERMPQSVRRLLNRNAARLLAQMTERGAPAAVLWDSAEHWLQADDPAQAIAALRACARHALEIGHPSDAVRALRRAIDLPMDASERPAVRRELLTAAEIAADWPTVFETLEAMRAQLVADGHGGDLEPELELLSNEAWLATARDPAAILDRIRRRAHDETLTARHRLRACRLLTSVAEALLSAELGAEAYEAGSRVDVDESSLVDRLLFEMMHQASFGDVDCAVAPARRLIALAASQPKATTRCRMLTFGSAGLIRAGLLDEGCDVGRAAYDVATACRLRTWQQRAATMLATWLREADQLVEALMWHERSRAAFEHVDGRENAVDFYSNCVQFAMEAGDYAQALEWLRRARSDYPRARVGGAGLHFRALELRVRQLTDTSYDLPQSELSELLDIHLRLRGIHQHDDMLEALWHALARKGRTAEGDALVRDYFTRYRRHRLPVGARLREVLAAVDHRVVNEDRLVAV